MVRVGKFMERRAYRPLRRDVGRLTDEPPSGEGAPSLDPETLRRRRRGNLVIALSIVAFVALIFAVTLVRLGGNIASRTF